MTKSAQSAVHGSQRFAPAAGSRRHAGQSLIVALVLLAFLTTVMGTVTLALLGESRAADERSDRLAAFYLARAGIEAGMDQLRLNGPLDAKGPSETKLGDGIYRFEIADEGARININTADADTLHRADPALSEELVKTIVERRAVRPFLTVNEVADLPGAPPSLLSQPAKNGGTTLGSLLTVCGDGKPNVTFSITAVGHLADSPLDSVRLRQVVRREADGLRVLRFEQLPG